MENIQKVKRRDPEGLKDMSSEVHPSPTKVIDNKLCRLVLSLYLLMTGLVRRCNFDTYSCGTFPYWAWGGITSLSFSLFKFIEVWLHVNLLSLIKIYITVMWAWGGFNILSFTFKLLDIVRGILNIYIAAFVLILNDLPGKGVKYFKLNQIA